ncbi:MAG: vWA domain-containing protein, partial [Turicibacter sp.]|nr:vWA domain-containing protein [Turicibacter sp.]
MKKKNYFIGFFLIVTTLLFTMVSSVEANNQIENEFQTNNILTQFKLQNNLWYSGNQINNLNSTLDRLTSNLEFQQSNTNNLSPNINVELSSFTPKSGPNGQEVEVTYTITLGDFTEYISNNSNHSSIVEEAVFIFDTSSNMNQNAWNSAIRNGIVRNINDSSDIKNSGMKIGLIGYNSSVVYANDDENTANLYDYSKPEEVEKLRVLLQEEKIRIDWNNSSRNITDALKKANSILSQSSDDKEKAIVIISTDKIQADSEIIKQIKSQGYRIISFYLGNVGSNVTDSYSLEDLHYQLGGVEEHYIITSFDQGNCNNAFNDMQKVRDSLLGLMGEEKVDTYKLDLMLNFDLGDGFLPVRGITQKQGTLYQVNIPSITYTPVTKNDDGTYTYEADQKQIEVSFTVKVDTNQIGDITFSNKDDVEFNNLTYTNLNDEEIKVRIETPTFTVVGEPELPTYSNDTIKILEIEPADYFQLGSSQVLETGTEKLEVNGEVIEITRMTMPEFIGKAEKINGKYDVVVIGRLVNTDWGDDPKNQSRYQDYRFERSNDSEENDITNRKAQEIIDFIDSGQ